MGNIIGYYAMPHPPIIIPEVGKGEETKLTNTWNACMKISEEIQTKSPDTIIVITPHGPVFRDGVALSYSSSISGDFSNFDAAAVTFKSSINMELTDKIITLADEHGIPTAKISAVSSHQYGISMELDHGTMIPLYFINKKYTKYKLVHITYGFLPKNQLYRFGILIRQAVESLKTRAVIIASGDLSHKLTKDGPYGFTAEGPVFDKELTEHLKNGDALSIFGMGRETVEKAGECGLRSFYIMLGSMDCCNIKGTLLSYEGPFGVGYGVFSFQAEFDDKKPSLIKSLEHLRTLEKFNTEKCENLYVKLARMSLENYVKHGEYIAMPSFVTNEMLQNKNGVFVSLKKDGELRGCIGTIFPAASSCAEEIIRNAVSAGQNDPRFYPVEEDELDELTYSVDILMPPEASDRNSLDPLKYGVIVKNGHRSGLLLPNLEGVNTIDEQLDIALNKAGIRHDEDYGIQRFQVVRYK